MTASILRKLSFVLAIAFLPLIPVCQNTDSPDGITPGTLTFTVKTVTNNSTYSPKNVLAIWIKDAQGNFVVSRKVMAMARKAHLVKWNASSAGNTVTAITGATLPTHQTHTISWDGKNAAGIEMPDGTYQIWVEYSSTNSASNGNLGPFLTVEFEKGPAIDHVTPANASYFQDIVADWVPLGVGKNELLKARANVTLFPNPFTDKTNIEISFDKPSQISIYAYNATGQKVAEIANDSYSSAGNRNYQWNGTSDQGQKLNNGLYFIHIQINGFTEIRKVILKR